MGGSCGCCSCGCCTRDVEREFYVHTILSADETIEHWEAAVEAGKNILWDSLSEAMEKIASKRIDEFGKSLEKTEKLIISALDEQFDVIKTDKEALVNAAQNTHKKIKGESENLFVLQKEILGKSYVPEKTE